MEDSDEDVVKFVMLYLSHVGLLGVDNKNVVKYRFLHLADDLDAISGYLWGYVLWTKMVDFM